MEKNSLQIDETELRVDDDSPFVFSPKPSGQRQRQREFLPESEAFETPFLSGEDREAGGDSLTASVGQNGANRPNDVQLVQRLINAHLPIPLAPLLEDGKCGPKTIFAIKTYQQRVLGMNPPDGRVDPGGRTFRALHGDIAPPTPPGPAPNPAPGPSPSGNGPRNMRPAAWQYLLQFTKKHEGAVLHMYNNRPATSTKQDVTCGIGFLLDPREVVIQPWVKTMFYDPATNQTPLDTQMLADWDAAEALSRTGTNLGEYAKVCHMRMYPDRVYDRMAVILRDQKLPALLKSFPDDFRDFANYPAAAQVFCVSFAYGRLPFDFPQMRASIRDGRWADASQQCRLRGASELKNKAHQELLLTAQQVVDQHLDPDTLPPLAGPQHEFEQIGESTGYETFENPLGELFQNVVNSDSRQFESDFAKRETLQPARENLDANEITVVLDRTPAMLVLHQFLNSPQMRQAAIASLLGKSARRSVNVHGVEVPIPAYLRVVSRLCSEAAEQAEAEEQRTMQGNGNHQSRYGTATDTETSEYFGGALEQSEFQVASDTSAPQQDIAAALEGKGWARALSLAIQAGTRDESDLANLVFFARHPELPRAKLDPKTSKYKQLSTEWSQILNGEVWSAIKVASKNTALVVSGAEVADHDRFYWGTEGKRLKRLVESAAQSVDLNPGLLGTIIMAETRQPLNYLTGEKVSSYLIGTDDFYEARAAIAARVPAYAKVHWDKTQTPQSHLNDATTPREVKSILFDSGPDALLATAVYIKFREVRLREIAKELKGDFDSLPVETRFALTRMAMAAGTAGTTSTLKDALAGKDILIRKAIPVKIYQTKRNATVRAAQAMHLSQWIFGIALASTNQPQPGVGQHEANEATEFESAAFPGLYSQSESEAEDQVGKIGMGTSKHVTNTQEVPFRWICAIETATAVTETMHTRTSPLKRVATGILISPCHVLTAAHVIRSARKDERNIVVSEEEATAAEVIPELDGSTKPPFGKFKVKSWVLHPKWNPRVENAKTDYALLTLEKCVEYPGQKNPSPGFWPLEIPSSSVRAALIGGDVVTAGYPESKNNEMWCFTGKGTTGLAQIDANVLQNKTADEWVRRTPVFSVTADAEHGQSGSPVWVKQQDRISLVGMLVKANTTSNEALTINEEVVNLLQSWMAPSGPAHEAQAAESLAEGWHQSEIEHAHAMPTEAPFVSKGEIGEVLESFEEFEDKPPRGLALLDHMHIPKTLDLKASGGFKIGTKAIVMKPSAMNPGFVDEHDEVVTNRSALSLQTCLDSSLTGQFSKFLARKGATKADSRDRVRVALVDLTGTNLSQPEFAGWGSTVAMYGASSPKMLAVYAAFQLRKDLRQMAEDQAIPTGKELAVFALKTWKDNNLRRNLPNLTWLFEIEKWSAKPDELNFSAAARAAFARIVENDSASLIIRHVGFPYIASVAWQSGLRHPMRGGLWLTRAYDGGDGWADNPAMKATAFVHNITALSVVTFYTLLAQGRLVDDASSAEITAVLRNGCPTCLLPPEIVLEATKCGVFKPFLHDCILAHHGGARYAAAILTEINATWPDPTKCPTGEETVDYTNLCRAMDSLLVGNQSSPKTKCE